MVSTTALFVVNKPSLHDVHNIMHQPHMNYFQIQFQSTQTS